MTAKRAAKVGKKSKKLCSLDELEREYFSPDVRAEIHAKAREKITAIRLQRLREKSRVTQETLAKKLGISQAALSKMERRENMQFSTILAYLDALGAMLQMRVELISGEKVDLLEDPAKASAKLRRRKSKRVG